MLALSAAWLAPAIAQEGQTCREAFEPLYSAATDKVPCTKPACLALFSIDTAIKQITGLVEANTGAGKEAVLTAVDEVKKQRQAIKEKLTTLGSAFAGLPDISEHTDWIAKLTNAKLVCEQLVDRLKESISAQLALYGQQRDLKVCKDKHERLPEFLKRYFALNDRDAQKGAPGRLEVINARYGDILNEDRDFLRQTLFARQHPNAKRPKPSTPRAGLAFTDPEEFAGPDDAGNDLWKQRRHTCEVSWYFRRHCSPTAFSKVDATWAGSDYCLLSIAEEKLGDVLCGYDPSPQGVKQFHIQFTCDGKTREERKFPGNTRRIHLVCKPGKEDDLASETQYFRSEPCGVDVGGAKALALAVEQEIAKKAAEVAAKQAEADKAKSGSTTATKPAGDAVKGTTGGSQ